MQKQKYINRIEVISARKHSGSYNHLIRNQQKLYNVARTLTQENPNKVLKRQQIEEACGDSFDFNNRSNLITDFCYNKVNLEDNPNKFLVSYRRGEFIFVDFNWLSQKDEKITWRIMEFNETFVVGSYKNGFFEWNFHDVIQFLNSSK